MYPEPKSLALNMVMVSIETSIYVAVTSVRACYSYRKLDTLNIHIVTAE
jgi:hypothetical protein